MGYTPRTKSGHSMYDMSSMLQKSIRRCDFNHAGYAANELYWSYGKYLWKRLLVISAEDCFGIITKEIVGLKMADDIANEGRKGEDKDPIFVAKAITLLCTARKNRDACYFACNYMCIDRLIDPGSIEHVDLNSCHLDDGEIPDWVFDIHTLKGRQNGKTDLDMTIDEQKALTPLQVSLFDNEGWEPYYQQERKNGSFSEKEWFDIERFIADARNRKIDETIEAFENKGVLEALTKACCNGIGRTVEERRVLDEAYKLMKSQTIIKDHEGKGEEICARALDVLQAIFSERNNTYH